MKVTLAIVVLAAATVSAGCMEKATVSQTAKEERDAQARAEALKKEMETAPKAFASRDVFKKAEPVKPADRSATANAEQKP